MTSSSTLGTPAGIYAEGRDAEDLNADAIDTLNDLLEICCDGEYGFRECAEHTKALDVKTVLNQRASECRFAATELQAMIKQMGSEPKEGGTVSAALQRGWVSVKGTLSGYSDYDMLDVCERAEDVALGQYRKALKQSLPASAMALVEKQSQGVQRNHDQIKAMRDALKT
ncbi:MAG: PA2169 family four-helix-bundle protein [Vitreoscilla sp.]|nr:PA2169 family four-helix-bundle protein [Polaromonas sp.]